MMKKNFFPLILTCLFGACSHEYYVSPDGNDANSGKSPARAWKTIGKVNETDFAPGSSILFEGGGVFEGTIRLSGTDAGSPDRKLTLSSFGEGKAVIQGRDLEGLVAED